MKPVYNLILAGSVGALVLLSGCGGGGGGSSLAGIGGTGRVASGTITGFGSIFVNEGRYDIDSASCDVDDEDRTGACQANLAIGMVVTVVSEDFDGISGTAVSVIYDDDVEGPVTSLIDDGNTKRFVVLGITVVVDSATTVFDDGFAGFTFDTMVNGDIVEISGFFDGAGVLNATYIEKKGTVDPGTSQVEIKGKVANAGTNGAGAGDSFTVNGVTVNIDGTTDLSDIPGGLVLNNMYVEAEGVFTSAAEIDALRVEIEDDSIGENEDDASIEGLVSNYVSNSNFRVAGQQVDASSARIEPVSLQLADGLKVEVEGPVISGILIADEVEAEGGDIEINASVSSVSTNDNTVTLTLGSIPGNLTVRIDADTEIEDESGGTLTLPDINNGDFLEVRAFDDGTGAAVATEIRRSADTDNDVILQGPMDNFDPGGSITVLGILFAINASTDFEDENENLLADANAFDLLASSGEIVKVKDNDPSGGATPDGVADEIDLED